MNDFVVSRSESCAVCGRFLRSFLLIVIERKREERESKPSREMHNSLGGGGGGGGFTAHPNAPVM